jgi:ATP-binding cassette subfamily B protein
MPELKLKIEPKNEIGDVGTLQKPLAFLWPLLRPYKQSLTGGILAMLISSLMMLAVGWGLKEIVDHGFSDSTGDFLNHALLLLLVAVVMVAVSSYTRLRLIFSVAERVTADLRCRIYTHLLSLDPAFFEQHKTGDQVSRINADTTVLQLVVTNNLPSAFRHSLMLLGGTVMLCVVSPSMTGVVLLVVPLVIIPMVYFGRRVRAKSRDTQSRIGDISSYTHETLQGIQTVQSFGYEEEAAKRFGGIADQIYQTASQYIHARALLTAVVISVIFGAIGVMLWLGGHKVLKGEMTAGDLSAFIFYVAMVAQAVVAVSESTTDFSRASGAADRIMQLLSMRPAYKAYTYTLPDPFSGMIEFDNVSFSYPARPGQSALEGISFAIRAGEVTALVGASGAGKSTVFQLLQRFYDPQQGMVSIDGVDITGVDPVAVRKLFGVVSQDPAIFSMSVADNIRMGRPDARYDEIRQAAELAQAHEFISVLPHGYETVVGERGSQLSGGQRQRIAIARAILKNPQVLLLDEATSALDSANEQAVHLALKNLMRGRTTIVIAHRLSTVQGAHHILVIGQGRLIAEGTHDSLYGRDNVYTRFAELQMSLKAG